MDHISNYTQTIPTEDVYINENATIIQRQFIILAYNKWKTNINFYVQLETINNNNTTIDNNNTTTTTDNNNNNSNIDITQQKLPRLELIAQLKTSQQHWTDRDGGIYYRIDF